MKATEFIKMKPHVEAYCIAREKILEERQKEMPFAARYLEGRLDEIRKLRHTLDIIMASKREASEVHLI